MRTVNTYWETGEKNKYGKEYYKLHFTEFYDDKVILSFVQDKDDDGIFIYVSELLNVEYDEIVYDSGTIDEVKNFFEDMVVEHWQDEISRLEECIEKFNECAKQM